MADFKFPPAGGAGPALASVDWTGGTITDPNGVDNGIALADGSVALTVDASAAHSNNSSQAVDVQQATGFAFTHADDALVISCDISNITGSWANVDGFGVGVVLGSTWYAGWCTKTTTGWKATGAKKGTGINAEGGADQTTEPDEMRVTVLTTYNGSTYGVTVVATLYAAGVALSTSRPMEGTGQASAPSAYVVACHDGTAVVKTVTLSNFKAEVINRANLAA